MSSSNCFGRSDEIAAIDDAARAGRNVVVIGPSGIGKTRLLQAALDELDPDRSRATWITATASAAATPLGAFAMVVPRAISSGTLDATLVIRDTVDALAAPATDAAPHLLVVDDAHLLDDLSATLVQLAASHPRVAVVISRDATASAPDAVLALDDNGRSVEVELGGLSVDALIDWVASTVEGYVHRGSAERLRLLSDGNPWVVRELLSAIAPSIALPLWVLPDTVALSPALERRVDSILASCNSEIRCALRLVAFAEPFPRGVLLNEPEAGPVDLLVRRGLVVADGPDGARFRISHGFIAESIRARTTAPERGAVAARLHALMRDFSTWHRDVVRVASWALEAGIPVSYDELFHALELALEIPDWPRLEAFAALLLRDRPSQVVATALGSCYQRTLRERDTIALVERAAEWPGEHARDLAFLEVDARCGLLDDVDGARDAVVRWRARIGDQATFAEAQLAVALSARGLLDEAAAIAAAVIESPDLLSRLRAAVPASTARLMRGDTASVLALTAELMAEPDTLSGTDRAIYVGAPRVLALLAAGQLNEADNLLTAASYLIRGSEPKTRAATDLGTGRLRLLQGRPRSAVGPLREAAFELLQGADYGRGPWAYALLAEALATSGDLPGAEQAAAAAETYRDSRFPLYDLDAQRARAWVLAARGEVSAARRALMACAVSAREVGMVPFELMALHDALRMGATETVPALARINRQMDGHLPGLFLRHARDRNDAVAMEKLSDDFEVLGMTLLAAEAAVESAQQYERDGQFVDATRMLEQSTALRTKCEGAITPVLATARLSLRLTKREREVAMLAARGRSSREISDSLNLSIRTIDNHLGKAYVKLGVSNRNDLSLILPSTLPENE